MSMARNNDWKSNLSLFESGVKASPNSSRAHYSLATEYAEQARKSRDPRSRDKLLSATVDHFRTSLLIKPDNVESLYNLGNTLCVLGDTTSALEKYRTAVRLHPAYISALNNLSGVYVSRNQLDSALIYLKQAYSFNANDVNLTANIASVSFFAGLYDQAIDYAGRALKLDPTNRKSYGVLVDSYTRLGQSEVAERYRKIMPLR
jgi:tetratricopeptide (TPR) repeat protein